MSETQALTHVGSVMIRMQNLSLSVDWDLGYFHLLNVCDSEVQDSFSLGKALLNLVEILTWDFRREFQFFLC